MGDPVDVAAADHQFYRIHGDPAARHPRHFVDRNFDRLGKGFGERRTCAVHEFALRYGPTTFGCRLDVEFEKICAPSYAGASRDEDQFDLIVSAQGRISAQSRIAGGGDASAQRQLDRCEILAAVRFTKEGRWDH